MNKKDLVTLFSIFLPIIFIIFTYSAWDLIKINNINDYDRIIFYLFSLFCFYLMGIKCLKKI